MAVTCEQYLAEEGTIVCRTVTSALYNGYLEEAILEPINGHGMDYAIQALSQAGKGRSTILINYSWRNIELAGHAARIRLVKLNLCRSMEINTLYNAY